MDDCEKYFHLLDKVDRGKHEFLDWLEFLDVHIEQEDMYKVVIGWSEEKTQAFVEQWNFNMDELDIAIYDWDDEYIEGGEK